MLLFLPEMFRILLFTEQIKQTTGIIHWARPLSVGQQLIMCLLGLMVTEELALLSLSLCACTLISSAGQSSSFFFSYPDLCITCHTRYVKGRNTKLLSHLSADSLNYVRTGLRATYFARANK